MGSHDKHRTVVKTAPTLLEDGEPCAGPTRLPPTDGPGGGRKPCHFYLAIFP